MTTTQRLAIVKKTRKHAADSLYKALKKLLASTKPISEVDLREEWLKQFRKNKEFFNEGWYIPPPHGFIVFFGTDQDVSRTKFSYARPSEFWPRDDIFLDRKRGIVLVYFSPVHKQTGIIGDFEMTFYFGKDKRIQKHIKTCLEVIKKTADLAKSGIKISELVKSCVEIIRAQGLENDVYSINDPLGVNIGHNIPFFDKKLSEKNWQKSCDFVAKSRVFMNSTEHSLIKNGTAFTLEPRLKDPKDPSLPLVMFHTIMLIDNSGQKELLGDFDKIFKLVGMDYMLDSTF